MTRAQSIPNNPVHTDRPSVDYRPIDPSLEPIVSIVTPFHNVGEVFHETARSVLGQTLQQLEWLIVNDASDNPESSEILDSYRSIDPRIRVLDHGENRGPGATRNTGFDEARAEFVMQLDADDLLEPTALEKLIWFMISYPQLSFSKGYTYAFGAETYLWINGFHLNETFLESNVADVNAMVRKSIHQAVGGYDEIIRDGLEDWEFWLKCADSGFWGGTVPEPLTWYRRRDSHGARWTNWDGGTFETAFRADLQNRYPGLWEPEGFPRIDLERFEQFEPVKTEIPFANSLEKDSGRILMVLPWMTIGGSDKFNLDAVAQLSQRGWQITIVTTLAENDPWEHEFARYTSDIFALYRFLRPADYTRFIDYLIGSRGFDAIFISNSELGYLMLPQLRASHPDTPFIDLVHMEQPDWKSGGYPNMSNLYREQLDLTLATSHHLKDWMVERGAEPDRIEVCYTGIDPQAWQPDQQTRESERAELSVPDDLPVILYTARLMSQKQPRVFAATMRNLADSGHRFLAIAAGDGPDGPWLHQYIRNHGLQDQVRLLGAVSSERVKRLLQASDIFFLPSQWEGIALAIYEAMACELAVVGATVGGQAELVTPDTGVLIERGDEETEVRAYAKHLSALLESPEQRKELGRRARARVRDSFTLDEMANTIVSAIDRTHRLVKEDPRPPVTPGLARAHTSLAIEYNRSHTLNEHLWHMTSGAPDRPRGWRWRFYRVGAKLLGPLYRRMKDTDQELARKMRDSAREQLGIRPSDIPWE